MTCWVLRAIEHHFQGRGSVSDPQIRAALFGLPPVSTQLRHVPLSNDKETLELNKKQHAVVRRVLA
eukprot:4538335-Amphidinium_carterae.1